jgi:hypothetical protein
MKHTAIVAAGLAFAAALPAAPAFATQIKRTFVSAVGDDANVATLCQPSAPCRTFSAAYSVTIADGEINVLDPAAYGTLTITQGLSIQGHGFASITAQSGDAITINAGANDKINLRGLLIDGVGTGGNGIRFTTGASLNLQDSVIRNFAFRGIFFLPNASSKLSVSSTLVSDTKGEGILIQPNGSGIVIGVLDHVECDNDSFGLLVNGSALSGTLNVAVSNSVMANNTVSGIAPASFGAATAVMVRDSTIANNSGDGLLVTGGAATARVSRSTIMGNATGFATSTGGTLVSYGDNNLDGNTTNGTATATIGYH